MTLLVHALSTEFDFVFCDTEGYVFYCYDWNDEKWLFRWHNNHWVSLRKVTNEDIFPLNLSDRVADKMGIIAKKYFKKRKSRGYKCQKLA